MSDYSSCPNCSRQAKSSSSSNWFPVYKCGSCGDKYCKDCGGGGTKCPSCGSSSYSQVGKVYA